MPDLRIINADVMEGLSMTYMTQPPSRWTFEQPKLRAWVESWCRGRTLNLFAGATRLSVDEYRVDIDETQDADWHGDALDFVAQTDLRFDSVVFDPPYNARKAREKYEGRFIGKATRLKDSLWRVLTPRAHVISLGYDTVGMSASRGFRKIAVCVVCHGGDHNDTLCVVEEYVQPNLL